MPSGNQTPTNFSNGKNPLFVRTPRQILPISRKSKWSMPELIALLPLTSHIYFFLTSPCTLVTTETNRKESLLEVSSFYYIRRSLQPCQHVYRSRVKIFTERMLSYPLFQYILVIPVARLRCTNRNINIYSLFRWHRSSLQCQRLVTHNGFWNPVRETAAVE